MRLLNDQNDRETADNLKFKLQLDNDAKFKELNEQRHTRDIAALKDMLKQKAEQKAKILEDRQKA